ncbi:hypothetical protein [Pseudonocardia aurantiaca]|uniref:Uncharacterized protein n=1 Tax=Pseudonocardia aurantiaca TaxID=75290 RepID=A0ABW4FE01_9PSEU
MDTTVVWTLLAVLVAIAIAAPRYGVDSRWMPPGQAPAPPRRGPTVRGDLAALARRARRTFYSSRPRGGSRPSGLEQVSPSR